MCQILVIDAHFTIMTLHDSFHDLFIAVAQKKKLKFFPYHSRL